MEMLDALSQTFDHTITIVSGVASDQLGAPTPCREWTVRDLLAHTTGVIVNMGLGASGQSLLPDVNAVELDGDFGAQFSNVAARTLAAWTTRGLDGELDIGAGPMPAAAGISINLLDTTTHSWDIARATGQDPEIPDELATYVLAVAGGVVSADIRAAAGFDPAIVLPAGSSATDQLVAFLGRQP